MKAILCYLIIVVISISSCNDSETNNKVESSRKIKIDSPQIDLTSEDRYAYIKEVFKFNERLYVKADYVDFLIGEEAIKAEWRDKAYFVDGKDTITNITNDYYISNVNPKIRTFMIDSNASIDYIISDEGSQKLTPQKNPSLEQMRRYKSMETLLFLHITDGIIKSIDERFLP